MNLRTVFGSWLTLMSGTLLAAVLVTATSSAAAITAASATFPTLGAYTGTVLGYNVDTTTGHIVTVKFDINGDGQADYTKNICTPTDTWDDRVTEAHESQNCITFDFDQAGCITAWEVSECP